ncbi:hypothetical protein GCM10010406_37600 [Streptomyces thermolineatus]|uniref:Uncharacterized protein n=2 Tax=Streptomyces TaxID=1883 RepID=A0ABN3MBA9_9ACTN
MNPSAESYSPELDALLAAAARPAPEDPRARERALTAFRAAREEGALRAPARPEDDWRPGEKRGRRPFKVVLGAFTASVALGGAALAAGVVPEPFGRGEEPAPAVGSAAGLPSPDAGTGLPPRASSAAPSGAPGTGGSSRAPDGRPTPAEDEEARCRAYESVGGRGRALDSAAWQQLQQAAGGPDEVAEYCGELLHGGGSGSGRGSAAATAGVTVPDPQETAQPGEPVRDDGRDGGGGTGDDAVDGGGRESAGRSGGS